MPSTSDFTPPEPRSTVTTTNTAITIGSHVYVNTFIYSVHIVSTLKTVAESGMGLGASPPPPAKCRLAPIFKL